MRELKRRRKHDPTEVICVRLFIQYINHSNIHEYHLQVPCLDDCSLTEQWKYKLDVAL